MSLFIHISITKTKNIRTRETITFIFLFFIPLYSLHLLLSHTFIFRFSFFCSLFFFLYHTQIFICFHTYIYHYLDFAYEREHVVYFWYCVTLLNLKEFKFNHFPIYVKHHCLPFQILFLTVYEIMELYRLWVWITLLCDVVSGSRHGGMNRRLRDHILNQKLKHRKLWKCTRHF